MDTGGKKMKIKAIIKKYYHDYSIQARMMKYFFMAVVLIVLILELFIINVVANYYYGGIEQILKDRATLSAEFLNKSFNFSSATEKANVMLSMLSKPYDNKFLVQFIDTNYNLIIDSHGFSSDDITDENTEVNTPDVKDAFENKTSIFMSVHPSTGEKILSTSRALIRNNTIDGVIRYAVSLERVDAHMRNFTIFSAIVGMTIVAAFLLISSLIASTIINPLKKINFIAQEYAKGNFDVEVKTRYDDEVGHLADTMNFMASEIKNAEKLKIEFISSISHELRTPLTSIKGWSETLQMSEAYKKDSDIAIGLNIISTEAERLSIMVEELLDFSRFQSNTMKIIKKKVNLQDILFDVYTQFSNRRSKVSLTCDLKGEETIIYADKNRLKQIYINLVTNAIKFTQEDGKIEMTSTGYPEYIVTAIKDNGIGIDKESLPHIREKFYKGSSTMPGNGLGLAIVDELVKLQDGIMDIESELGKGTTVTIRFPAYKEKTETKEIAQALEVNQLEEENEVSQNQELEQDKEVEETENLD